MLILCRIAIAEAGKPYRKNIRQIPHFINQHDSYRPPCKCHVTQKSRNSSVLTITKGKKTFRRENLSQYQFLAALIFHKSKNSEGLTILLFEFSMTSCALNVTDYTGFKSLSMNKKKAARQYCGSINYSVSKLFAVLR